MNKVMRGYERVKRTKRCHGEQFNRKQTNVMFKRRERAEMVFDKQHRRWVKKGSW